MHWFATKKISAPSLLTLDDILTSHAKIRKIYTGGSGEKTPEG